MTKYIIEKVQVLSVVQTQIYNCLHCEITDLAIEVTYILRTFSFHMVKSGKVT